MNMKTIKYSILVLLLALLCGCMHKFEDYNTNPNQSLVGTIDPDGLMEQTIFKGAEGLLDRTFSINGELIQYTVSGTTNNSYHRYYIPSGVISGLWDHLAKYAANANHMYELAVNKEQVNYQALALTMKTYFMANLTDAYGDIPYSEAFTIYSENPITKMKFDTQEDVYKQFFTDLERANSLYKAESEANTKDVLYGGDWGKWKKFNNSLYLRLLMRLSNRAETFELSEGVSIAAKIQQIVSNPNSYPVFGSLEDAAVLHYTGVTPFQNMYGSDADMNSRRAAEYIINYMWETRDPRIDIYYRQSGNTWNGQKSGYTSQEADNDNVAYLNKSTLGDYKSPYSFMRYDEVLFILAEATQRGMISGGQAAARQYYELAIDQSIRYWNNAYQGTPINLTLAIPQFIAKVPYDGTLKCIMEQKYIALFWNGFEAWHEYRRTEYPELPIGPGTFNEHILPRRFEYPLNTQATNPDNYAVVVSRMAQTYVGGGDNMRTPVWWSKAALENQK